MEQEKEIELLVRRLFAEDAGKHREYLELQFKRLTWSLSIIAVIIFTAFVYITGRSTKEISDHAKQRVDTQILTMAADELIEERLNLKVHELIQSDQISNQILASVRKKVEPTVGAVLGEELNKEVENFLERINNQDITIPRGTIIAWYSNRKTPSGWHICDGTEGTPDLRERFLFGAKTAEEIGEKIGNSSHTHIVTGITSPNIREGKNRNGSGIQGSYTKHHHDFETESESSLHIPPSIKVLFIMKL